MWLFFIFNENIKQTRKQAEDITRVRHGESDIV